MGSVRATKENPSMNTSTNSAEIEATAASWFAKREGGDWHAADQAQLEAWLDSSTAHRIAFIRVMTAWERSGRLNALGAGVPAGTIPPRGSWGFTPSSIVATPWAPQGGAESDAGPEPTAAPSVGNFPQVRASSSRFMLLR